MKTITHTLPRKEKLLHIEAEGCIINVTIGLIDMDGHKITNISIITDQYAGEQQWSVAGSQHIGLRVVQETEAEYEARRAYLRSDEYKESQWIDKMIWAHRSRCDFVGGII